MRCFSCKNYKTILTIIIYYKKINHLTKISTTNLAQVCFNCIPDTYHGNTEHVFQNSK